MKIYENLDISDLGGEVWKVITDFPDYSVSNLGRVKRVVPDKWNHKCRILKQWNRKKGYLAVELNGETQSVHRLVLMVFKPVINMNELQCNHIDGNKKNNYYENLEWLTDSENKKHAYKIGLKSEKGEKNNSTKLDNKKVIQIKMLIKLKFKLKYISEIYNVTISTISYIKIGKTWNHIKI